MTAILVGTAGHIDHGKSRLVLALTGTDPDRLPEEKARGITIDLGFAHGSWGDRIFSFVDVPGHEKFIRTMVAGAYAVDVALLCVASDDSVMPQTREHLAILQILGVPAGVVARTKSDLVDEAAGALVDAEIRALLRGTFLENAPIVPVSAETGAGLDALREALLAAGSTSVPRDPLARDARLFIDRAFTQKGFGAVVTGTLDGGRVRAGDTLTHYPPGRPLRVRRVETHGAEVDEAVAGTRTSLALSGITRAELSRGHVLVGTGGPAPTSILTVFLTLLPSAAALETGARLRIHLGSSELFGKLSLPGLEELAPGTTALAQVFLESGVPARRGDRFVVRRPSPSETVGGGRVVDTARPRIKAKGEVDAKLSAALASSSDDVFARFLLEEAGPRGLTAPYLAARLGVTEASAEALLARLREGGAVSVSQGVLASRGAKTAIEERLAAFFAARKAQGAPSAFAPRAEALAALGKGFPHHVAESWILHLTATKVLTAKDDQVGPHGTAEAPPNEASSFASRIAEAYRLAGFEEPRAFELAKALAAKTQVVEGLVGHLLKSGVLVRLSPDLVVHKETVDAAAAKLVSAKGRPLRVGDFRDLLGLTRKTLIPLLEHFDARKLTRRNGDFREVV